MWKYVLNNNNMMKVKKGEYLAPEVEVVEVQFQKNVLLNASITDSGENTEVGW